MRILGLSAFYHDSAAALIEDGEVVAAAQEERFTRIKHDNAFPKYAASWCLRQSKSSQPQLDYVVFYDKPVLKFDRLLETSLAFAPKGARRFVKAMPLWLKYKLHLRREIRKHLSAATNARLVFTSHHESHAAAAFYPSPFSEAAVLTVDGVGEWGTASCGFGESNQVELWEELQFPHSLGLLYSAFTYYCGFAVNSGEYKLMGLAPYGEPRFRNLIWNELVDVKEDGSFWMNMEYFNYCHGFRMTNKRFDRLFGASPRSAEASLTRFYMDVAASIQAVTEEILIRMARHVKKVTGARFLCLGGGVALNCVANGKILRENIFDDIWIQPAAGDAGGALGGALFTWYQLLNNQRNATGDSDNVQQGSLLGPAYTEDDIQAVFDKENAVYHFYHSENDLLNEVVELIDAGNVVGWFKGRMEFGPRALGNRSILADARNPEMQERINAKIKHREPFRPFAPAVLKQYVNDYFELDRASPYMLLVAQVAPSLQGEQVSPGKQNSEETGDSAESFKSGSMLPAVTHVDGSARIQTVDPVRHNRFYRLLERFNERTGIPVMINTSFNVGSEPIVCSPEDAWNCFIHTDIDVLVCERFLLFKDEQLAAAKEDEHGCV